MPGSEIYLVTGIQAAGKSTVAQLLAERLTRSVHVRGDLFRRMIVNGRAEITPQLEDALSGAGANRGAGAEAPDLAAAAMDQLRLRYELAATVTDRYAAAGFSVVVQDIVLAENLEWMIGLIRSRPLYVVVLAPDRETVAARERGRGKTAYGVWQIAELDEALRKQTPRIGLWLDTSRQTPDQTVAEILARAPVEAAVP